MLKRGSTASTVVVRGCLIAFMLLFAASIATIVLCSETGQARPPTALVDDRGVLSVEGGIDDSMLAAVKRALAGTTSKVTLVRVNSFGGQANQAAELGRMLAALDVPVEVPPGATCQSACVALLVDAPKGATIAPSATVMFHEDATRFGLANQGFCGTLNDGMVWLSERWDWAKRQFGDNQPPLMLSWASRLDAKLPTLFALCRTNPLRTQTGITLTGADLDGLRNGSIAPSALTKRCPAS